MTALPIALALGGSALSGLFGGAKDPGPSEVHQNSREDALNQMARYYDSFYGSNWRKAWGPGYGDGGSADLISGRGGDKFSRYNYAPQGAGGAGAAGGGTGAASGNPLYGGNTPYGTAPILQQLYAAQAAGLGENQRAMNDFNTGSEQGYREAAKYGTGQNAVIEGDAALALKNANALSQARLNGMGLGGSTIATDAMGANATGNLRELTRAKADLADRATGLRLQQRNQSTAGRAALSQGLNQSNQNLRMMPIQGQLNAMGSPITNPYSVTGGAAPATAQNSLLSSLGNTASQLGGLYLANSLYNPQTTLPDSYDNYAAAGFPRPH